jgi:hypothetical protein
MKVTDRRSMIQALGESRTYSLAANDQPGNAKLIGNGQSFTTRMGWADNKDWFNKQAQNAIGSNSNLSQKDVMVSFPDPINASRWMTELWPFISKMNANEFIFPGCHDALSSYTLVSGNADLDQTQSIDLGTMINSGCRYFDIRLNDNGTTWVGWHGGTTFDVTQAQVVQALSANINRGNTDIFIMSLMMDDAYASDFDNLINAILTAMPGILIPNTPYTPASTLADLVASGGRIILLYNGINNQNDAYLPTQFTGNTKRFMWVDQNYGIVDNWPSGVSAAFTSGVDTPAEWLNYGEKGLKNRGSSSLFNFLAMSWTRTTSSTPTITVARELNGALADWIYFNSPDHARNRTDYPSGYNSGNFTLPYPKGMRNYNIISMDFFQFAPFILNSMAQNVLASLSFYDIVQFDCYNNGAVAGGLSFYYGANSQSVPIGFNYDPTFAPASFYAYRNQLPGTVPVYYWGLGSQVYFLGITNQPGNGFVNLDLAFYAYPSLQVAQANGVNAIELKCSAFTPAGSAAQMYFYTTGMQVPVNAPVPSSNWLAEIWVPAPYSSMQFNCYTKNINGHEVYSYEAGGVAPIGTVVNYPTASFFGYTEPWSGTIPVYLLKLRGGSEILFFCVQPNQVQDFDNLGIAFYAFASQAEAQIKGINTVELKCAVLSQAGQNQIYFYTTDYGTVPSNFPVPTSNYLGSIWVPVS